MKETIIKGNTEEDLLAINIANEKKCQKRKIINYTIILIIMLLLIKCGSAYYSNNLTNQSNSVQSIGINKLVNNNTKVLHNTKFIQNNIIEINKTSLKSELITKDTTEQSSLKLSKEDIIHSTPKEYNMHAASKQYKQNTVPKGFENILDSNFSSLFSTINVNGKEMGITQINIDNKYIYFKNINEFLYFIKDFKYKSNISNLLEDNKLSKNIKIPEYTIYFNPENETIYVNSFSFNINNLGGQEYLPLSNNDFSVLQNINLSYFNDINSNFSIGGDLYFTKNEHKIITNWNKNQDDFNVNNLYYNWENELHNISTGYLNYGSSSNSLIGSNEFLGLKYKENSNKVKNVFQDEKIIINVSSDSIIKFFKDGELVLTKSYESGIHYIPTSLFPEGNYLLDIEINNGQGIITQQEYIKNSTISKGFSFDIGFLKKEDKNILFNTEEEIFFKTSYLFNLLDNISFTPEILYFDGSSVFNTNFGWSNDLLFIDLNLLTGNKNADGKNINLGVDLFGNQLSYSFFDIKESQNWFTSQRNLSHRINYNYNTESFGNINFFYNKSNYYRDNEIYGIKYSNRYQINLKNNINYGFSLSKNNDESTFGIQVSYQFYNKGLSFQSSIQNDNNTQYTSQSSISRKRDFNNYTENFSLSNTIYSNSDESYNLAYSIQNENYGYFEHNFRYKNQLQSFGNARTNIGYNNKSTGYGGERNNSSGVILNIESSEDTYFYVTINKRKYTITSNKNTFIPLQPYQEFILNVEPIEENFSQKIMQPKREFTLSKGNVKHFNWVSKKTALLIGNLYVNESLITNKSFNINNNFSYIDNDGLINITAFYGDNILIFDDFSCTININSQKDFIFDKKIICKKDTK